jgi:tetratricopeptide (TPR) repeat protein
MMRRVAVIWLVFLLLGGLWGCGPKRAFVPPPETKAAPEPVRSENSDQAKLKEGLTGRELSPAEVADLSDRLLADNGTLNDQETMARLELLILKAIKGPDRTHRPVLWRNLGIMHYHQKKYKQAQQELQGANELNPKNARTHFYLACLFAHQGAIYEKKGKKRVSRQQYKRASIEMEQARKLEPQNPLYKQDPKQVIQQENGK